MVFEQKIVATTNEEKRKLFRNIIVLLILPFVFILTGFWLKRLDSFWSVFAWIGGAMLMTLFVIKIIRAYKDGFYSNKIIYSGLLREVNVVKVGYGTSASNLYEFVLEKKTLRLGERGIDQSSLLEVPLPEKGEEVEIHTLLKSYEVIQFFVKRNGRWDSLKLID